ncbi:MAG: SDR family oxidoreductase [Verrucomicrobia bacterium]|nr:SDR family oxidoreductase [Verrucomicrobiota bacterium]
MSAIHSIWGIAGRTAIVTGTGGKIGARIAGRLLEAGCKVALLERSPERAQKFHPQLAEQGPVHAEIMDVSDPTAWRAVMPRIQQALGEPTLLANNAAGKMYREVTAIDAAEAIQSLQTNLLASFYAVREMTPFWKRAGSGAVVTTSSIHAIRGYGKYSLYAAAKGGLEAATRDWALEFGSMGIRFNVVSPGNMDTYVDVDAWLAKKVAPEHHDEFRRRFGTPSRPGYQNWQPLRVVGNEEHIADAALFLLSERARFITGHTLVVDGGAILVMGYDKPREAQAKQEETEMKEWVQAHAPHN